MLCTSFEHTPVLLKEVLGYLDPKSGESMVDGTLGLGGHSMEILKRIGSQGHLYGFDLDQRNLRVAQDRLSSLPGQVHLFHDNFVHCQHRLREKGIQSVDGILLDLGLSSPHIDDQARGFSFQQEGPLDMRFDASAGQSAAELVNQASGEELKRIIYEYGEERYAPKLARLIVEKRTTAPFETTHDLMGVVETIMKSPSDQRRVATRLFQALRVAVNDELRVLETALPELLELLAPQGRLVVISYHSLEDRLVKRAFRQAAKACRCPKDQLRCTCDGKTHYEVLTRKPVVPTESEINQNSRSRSAKLRAIKRLS